MNNDWIKVQLKGRGIKSERVLESFKNVNRRDFLSTAYKAYALEDTPLPIGYNQTISQPYIVAYMLEQLDLKKTDNVLEIGTGSGYQTALLALLTSHVTSIEREPHLSKLAQDNLKPYDFKNITLKGGDGALGDALSAPFDKIIVSCTSRIIPPKLLDQLAINGRLIIPLGGALFQTLTLVEKTASGIKKTSLLGCRFVPLISKTTSSF